jgi:hypothetical protein
MTNKRIILKPSKFISGASGAVIFTEEEMKGKAWQKKSPIIYRKLLNAELVELA